MEQNSSPFLRQRDPVAYPHERDVIEGTAFIDVPNTTIWLWQYDEMDPRWLRELEDICPSWKVEGHIEGIARQALLSGRNPASIMLPDAEVAQRLVSILASGWSFDPGNALRFALSDVPAEATRIEIAPSFLRTDPPTLTAAQRWAVLEQYLRDLLG